MIHIKSRNEIERMRDAGKLAREVLNETALRAKAGVTTLELNDFAHKLTRKNGAESAPLNYRGFPKSICTSLNNVVCHGIPKKNEILKDGDILNIDITVRWNGFHGDTSKMVAIGEISQTSRALLLHTERAMYVGIETIRPGSRVSAIGEAIDGYLTPKHYGIVRDLTGHGIGKSFHEEPSIPHYRQNIIRIPLRAGMIFTVEPMVNTGSWEVYVSEEDGWTVYTSDGSLSAQYEHTCLVTEEGYEILT